MISVTDQLLPDRPSKEVSINTIESIGSSSWRMLFGLVISGTGEALSERAAKEKPIATTESAAFLFSNLLK